MLENQRHLFSLPDSSHYLNCAYLSPLLKTVEAAGIAGVRRKSDPTAVNAEDFFTEVEGLRARVGQLVNCSPDRVAFIPAVSYGVALAVRNMPVRAGQNVVSPGEEFPSNLYGWMDRCREVGGEVRLVPRPKDVQRAGEAWNADVLEAIDDNTALVTLSEVHWTDGTLFDLERIGARARQVGAMFIVDGTQSVGARPFDFAAVRPDLLICAGYKWCLGPYSYGFVVVGDRMLEGKPIEMNWINREASEDFSQLINYRDGFRKGARRFDVGEHSNFILVPMLSEAIRQILEWGPENIQGYCAGLARQAAGLLAETEFAPAPPEEHAAHIFGIHLPDPGRAPHILEELKRREVFVSLRGTSVRVAPHVYNTADDLAALAEALLASRG